MSIIHSQLQIFDAIKIRPILVNMWFSARQNWKCIKMGLGESL